jgi:hypothetical protein
MVSEVRDPYGQTALIGQEPPSPVKILDNIINIDNNINNDNLRLAWLSNGTR